MNIFKQLIVSLYSPKDISTFHPQGTGKTILFVFLLTLLSIMPTLYYFNSSIKNGVEAIESTIKGDLPEFTIENGELKSDETLPLTIRKDEFTIIFDSTGTITNDQIDSNYMTIYFLKNEFTYAVSGQTETIPYSVFSNSLLTKDDILEFLTSLDSFLPLFVPVTGLLLYVYTLLTKFIGISVLAIFGLLIRNTLQKNLTYGQLWRMSAYCVTLPTIFIAIMESLQTTVPSEFLVYWFVSTTVLLLSLKELPTFDKTKQ